MKKFRLVKILSLALLLSTLGGTILRVQAASHAQKNDPVRPFSEVSEFPSSDTAIPTPLEPADSTDSQYPQYVWSAVPNAALYQFEVYAGTHKMFLSLQGTSICDPNTCSYMPLRFLTDRGYTWRVRAKVSGCWQEWSAYKWFNVNTNFNSEFTSDTEGWRVVLGPWSLYNSNVYRSTGWLNHLSSIVHDNLYSTFTYMARMMRIGDTRCANRLYVRGTPLPLTSQTHWHNCYAFQYTNSGKFSVWKFVDGLPIAIKYWTDTGAINPFDWNLLKVIGNGTRLEFYINNKLVWVGNDSSLGTGRVGIGMYKGAPATPLWQPFLVDYADLTTDVSSSSMDNAAWAEIGETNTTWDNPDMSPPLP